MATPNEKLAASLGVLQELQKGGRRVFQSSELSRVHRDRLLKHGFMQAVMKGWLISASPVSYTHLDVYKRQLLRLLNKACEISESCHKKKKLRERYCAETRLISRAAPWFSPGPCWATPAVWRPPSFLLKTPRTRRHSSPCRGRVSG